jgi:hypothetical protein
MAGITPKGSGLTYSLAVAVAVTVCIVAHHTVGAFALIGYKLIGLAVAVIINHVARLFGGRGKTAFAFYLAAYAYLGIAGAGTESAGDAKTVVVYINIVIVAV